MKKVLMGLLLVSVAACNSNEQTAVPDVDSATRESGKLYVTVPRAQRRTCPSETCGDVGWAGFRQTLEPLERRGGWVRITKFYDANCVAGQSKYVDRGNAKCESKNGIVDGQFAEWIPERLLSSQRPNDPAEKAIVGERIVAQSDDFAQHHAMFAQVTNRLIAEGRCTPADFEEMGGWLKSVNEHRDEPVYFTYCGGMTSANKIYLNATTGEIL